MLLFLASAFRVYLPHAYNVEAKKSFGKFAFFFFFRKTARPHCCNRENRWLQPLYAVCKIFQLHCEGKTVFSYSKMSSLP